MNYQNDKLQNIADKLEINYSLKSNISSCDSFITVDLEYGDNKVIRQKLDTRGSLNNQDNTISIDLGEIKKNNKNFDINNLKLKISAAISNTEI